MKAAVFWVGLLLGGAFASGPDDPFAVAEPEQRDGLKAGRAINLVFEVFSLSFEEAAEVLRSDQSDEELYLRLVEKAREGGAEQELFQSVAARSGQEVTVRDGEDFIHPTESKAAVGLAYAPSLGAWEEGFAPPMPSLFMNRDLGWSLELEPVFDPEAGTIETTVSASRVSLSRKVRWGNSPVEKVVPYFSVGDLRTTVVASSGEVSLLGTVREGGPEGGQGPVGVAFLRATLRGDESPVRLTDATRLVYEVFALPLAEAARLRRVRKEEDLHRAVLAALATGKARQEEIIAWSGKPGSGVVRQIEEMSFPTDFDPSSLPQAPGGKAWHGRQGRRIFVHDYRSFETRNAGVEFVSDGHWRDGGDFALSLGMSHVGVSGRRAWGQGPARWEFPEFFLQRLEIATTLRPGQPTLIGSLAGMKRPGEVCWVFATMRREK